MVSSNYCSRTSAKSGDYSPAIFIPYFVYLLKLVGIDPFGQDLFFLFVVFCSNFDEGPNEQLVREDCNVSVVMFSLVVVWPSR
jgi:hypothetical protein